MKHPLFLLVCISSFALLQLVSSEKEIASINRFVLTLIKEFELVAQGLTPVNAMANSLVPVDLSYIEGTLKVLNQIDEENLEYLMNKTPRIWIAYCTFNETERELGPWLEEDKREFLETMAEKYRMKREERLGKVDNFDQLHSTKMYDLVESLACWLVKRTLPLSPKLIQLYMGEKNIFEGSNTQNDDSLREQLLWLEHQLIYHANAPHYITDKVLSDLQHWNDTGDVFDDDQFRRSYLSYEKSMGYKTPC